VPGLVADCAEVLSCDVLPRLAGWRPAVDLAIIDIRAALASVTATWPVDNRDGDGRGTRAVRRRRYRRRRGPAGHRSSHRASSPRKEVQV
jgi:hypothetical protein